MRNIFKFKGIKKELRVNFLYRKQLIAEKNKTWECRLYGDIDGWLGVYDILDNRVVVFKDIPIWRRGFVLIHELAHYFIAHFSHHCYVVKRNIYFDCLCQNIKRNFRK
jgi:Zn-dependent peptidase ImmA (M78 family)